MQQHYIHSSLLLVSKNYPPSLSLSRAVPTRLSTIPPIQVLVMNEPQQPALSSNSLLTGAGTTWLIYGVVLAWFCVLRVACGVFDFLWGHCCPSLLVNFSPAKNREALTLAPPRVEVCAFFPVLLTVLMLASFPVFLNTSCHSALVVSGTTLAGVSLLWVCVFLLLGPLGLPVILPYFCMYGLGSPSGRGGVACWVSPSVWWWAVKSAWCCCLCELVFGVFELLLVRLYGRIVPPLFS